MESGVGSLPVMRYSRALCSVRDFLTLRSQLSRRSSFSEPAWRSYSRLRHARADKDKLCWLLDSASLTQRLIQACSGRFHVELLDLGWATPLPSEVRVLRMHHGRRALIRQVLLCCDEQPWVFARTVIPYSSLRGRARRLAFLGEKPLGAVLFADPCMRRGVLQISELSSEHPMFAQATGRLKRKPKRIWGRRSVFYLGDKPLLVNEIFLPGIKSCKSLYNKEP
jgi:chorismate--pyruvate lyase